MAIESVLNYSDIVDARYNPFTNTWTPLAIVAEIRTVPASSPYWVKTFEIPEDSAPSGFTIKLANTPFTELTEVASTETPGNLEYRVWYDALGAGIVEFHANQASIQMDIDYSGLGHAFQKISLDTRVPSTGNTTIAGIKTFTGTSLRTSVTTKMSTGGETSPDCDNGGITLNHGANDGNVLTFKNSDIAHGATSIEETDTYAAFSKSLSSNGGVNLRGLSESARGIGLEAYANTENSASDTFANGNLSLKAYKISGVGVVSHADNANIFTVANNTTTALIIKGDGRIITLGGIQTVTGTGYSDPPTAAELNIGFPNATNGYIAIVTSVTSVSYHVFKNAANAWQYEAGQPA